MSTTVSVTFWSVIWRSAQYVALSPDNGSPKHFPDANNGVFYRNSWNGLRNITDGSSTTLMAGERSQNVANATWVGMIPFGQSCNNPSCPVPRLGEASNVLILNTGPSPDEAWIDVPNYNKSGADDFHSRHPGGCNFLFAFARSGSSRRRSTPGASFIATRAGGEVVSSDQLLAVPARRAQIPKTQPSGGTPIQAFLRVGVTVIWKT